MSESQGNGDEVRLMPAKRRRDMAALFANDPVIHLDSLADRFGVSRETVRRDLIALENQGLVERVHGGGMRLEVHSSEPSFHERLETRSQAKSTMAETAASLIGNSGSIFLDVGTSVARIADYLPPSFSGQVITNSIIAAVRLGELESVDVVLCGGRMRHGDLAISGPQAAEFLQDVFVEIAFLGCGGVDSTQGVTDFYLDEIALKRIVIGNSGSTYVLADSTKIGKIATKRVCRLDQITGVVTDAEADTELVAELQSFGIETHRVGG